MLVFPPFRLDTVNQCVWRDDKTRIALKPKPFAVLRYLVSHADRLVTYEELLDALWPKTYVQPEVLRQYVLEIRRALDDRSEQPRFVHTFPKRGYQFIAPVFDDLAVTGPATATATARVVGRDPAFDALQGHLKAAEDGQRQVVFVSGEAGIGKTTLVDEFVRSTLSATGVRSARGQSVEGFGGKEAYYPIFDALGELMRGVAGAPTTEIFKVHAPTWMVQFPSLLRGEERAALQAEIVGATRERMVREFCEGLEFLTRATPLVLVLEDLHWADHSTLDVISALARRRYPSRLLIIVTFRPADVILAASPLKTLRQDLVVHGLGHDLLLERLTTEDVAEYVTLAYPKSDLPRPFAELIHRHSDGNPLFVRALLDHLVQVGVLSHRTSRWSLTVPIEQIEPGVPDTLQRMLETQLERLTTDERQLLSAASVVGQNFTAWSVSALLSLSAVDAETRCTSLADRQQFLVSLGPHTLPNGGVTAEFGFRHALYRDALYRHIGATERVLLHSRFAHALEDLTSPVDAALAAQLATHHERGGEPASAVRMWLLAAQHETERFAHRESIDILEHARTLISQVSGPEAHAFEMALLAQIGDAHLQLGDMRQSIEAFQLAANLAAARGSISLEADALMLIAHPAAFVDPARGIGACERAAALADTMNDSVLRARATMLGAGWRILIDGWDSNVADSYKGAMTELLRHDKALSPYGHTMIARMQGLQSDYDHAYTHVDDAVRTLTTVNRLWELAPALAVKMFTLVFLGRLGEAHETITTALALATNNHNTTWLAIFRSYLAWIHLLSCDFEGVRELSTTQLMANSTAQAQVQMTVFEGFAALRTSRPASARECFDRARNQLMSSKAVLSWYWSAFVELGRSELALSRGDVVGASRQADDLIGAVNRWEESFVKVLAWELGARAALATSNHQLAKERIDQALLTVTQYGLPCIAWRVHATAWRLYAKHDPQRASKHRRAAQAVIRQVSNSLNAVESLQRTLHADPAVREIFEGVAAVS